MFPFALRRPRIADWRGWLPLAALPTAMFVVLLALGGDRWHFYRAGPFEGGLHNHNTAKTLAIAENLSPAHNFRLAHRIRQDQDGGFGYHLYGRFPVGGFAVVKIATLPFGNDLAAKLIAARVLMLIMFCGAAALVCLSIRRLTGSRRVALAATLLAFSGLYAVYYADEVSSESVMDVFGAALTFHGMTVFVQEGRFRQLAVKTCAALLLGWHVYALLLPFIALGFGGETVALWRSALASGEKAKAARAAIIALVRSRYAALAAVSILFGAALLAFNIANEYTALDGEAAMSELPLVESIAKRFGRDEDYNQREPALAWDIFLRRQLYRVGAAVVPYALARAVGVDFPISEAWEVALAPAVLGAAAVVAALIALALARRCRLLVATAVMFGFCWGLPMRYNTFHRWHLYEGLPYMGLALALFALALLGARAALGERLGGRVSLGLGAAAALVFALSVFYAGQLDRYDAGSETNKATLADFSAIRDAARGKRVGLASGWHESWGVDGSSYWSNQMRYYRAGTSVAWNSTACDEREFDFVASRYRDDSLNPLTPESGVAFLYAGLSPLELCRAERRRLESLEPAARAVFDVYLQDGAISYLKSPCAQADYEAPFFAYLYPADAADLPAEHRRDGFHPWNAALIEDRGAVFYGACLMTLYLPAYPIAAVETGQYIPGGGRVWEVAITSPLDDEARARYERIYQDAASGEPAARAVFDLYLDGDALTYLKEPCGESDTRGRFFLSVRPADVRDLPANLRAGGHESLNFDFAPPAGAAFNGKCIATRRLPDYPIAAIETGQWIPGGERLWGVEIVVGD